MGTVTSQTAIGQFKTAMFDFDTCYFFMLVFVTGKADTFGVFSNQGELVITAVGVVALNAAGFHRCMDMFFGGKFSLFVCVTIIADIVSLRCQKLWEASGMMAVAGTALAVTHRAMFDLAAYDGFFMTLKAEVLASPK